MKGWIKLHRKSVDSIVFQNEKLWKVWTWCLMRANHKPGYKEMFQGSEITLKAGQFITGRFQGAEQCKMRPSTFRDQISRLKKIGNLDITSDNKKSLITVINWGQYQSNEEDTDSNPDKKPTPNRQQNDTDKKLRSKDEIFTVWNEAQIIVHRKLTDNMHRRLNKALNDFSPEEIINSIRTYAEIIKSDLYYFNYKWSLDEYLQRGLQKFIDSKVAKENFLNSGNGKTASPIKEEEFI